MTNAKAKCDEKELLQGGATKRMMIMAKRKC